MPPDVPETAPPKPLRIHLVRHATSVWNDERRIQGQLDPPLSQGGRDQARQLARRLSGCHFEGFYSSDLTRARATAETIGEALGTRPVLWPELREVGLGEWEGLNRQEITARYPGQWERWLAEPNWDVVPGGEGTTAFERRFGSALERLLEQHRTGDLLVVTHGGVIQVLLLKIVGRGSHGLFPFTIHNTSITLLEGDTRGLVIGRVNDTCHLG